MKFNFFLFFFIEYATGKIWPKIQGGVRVAKAKFNVMDSLHPTADTKLIKLI